MNLKKSKRVEEQILSLLRKGHVLEVVCQQCEITRQTFSRWKREDAVFAKSAEAAVAEGKQFLNDISESQLVAAIKEGNLTAVMYFLKHNHPTYRNRLEISGLIKTQQEVSPEDRAAILRLLKRVPPAPAAGSVEPAANAPNGEAAEIKSDKQSPHE